MQPQRGRYDKGYFGLEVSFGRELKRAGYNPAIFKYCLGATGLAHDWKSPGDGGIYDHMAERLKIAIENLEDDGYEVNIRGFIWIQGESDSLSDEDANSYQKNLLGLSLQI